MLYLKMTGYTTEDILYNKTKSYADLIHPEDIRMVGEKVQKAIANNQRFALEYRILTRDGKEKWVWEQGVGLQEPNGQVNIIEGYIIDITDRKRAEAALKESEDKFKKAFQSSPTMIILSEAEKGTILEANASFEKITGWTKEEYYGKTTKEIGLWANPEDRKEYISSIINEGIAKNKEYDFRTKSGEIRNGLVSGHILNLHKGKIILGVLSDITEQKQYNINLDKEKTHLRTVIETIPELVFLKDPNGIYLNCNHQFEQFFGAPESEIVGKTDYDFIDKELADFFRERDKKAMQANQPTTNLEWVTYASDGHKALLETIKTPMYDSHGKLIGVLGIARDITEHKKIEDALRKSENWYKAIFENTGTATCIFDEDGTLILVNEKFEELCLLPKEELENKIKWTDFVSKEDLERMLKYHKERREEGKNPPKQYEFTLKTIDGKLHNILLNVDLIPETKMSVASLLDITPRVNALNQLKESHEKYQNLVENINDVIYELDSEWKFKYISPSIEIITGFTPESYIGKSFIEVIVPEDVERIQARYDNFRQTKIVAPVEFRAKNKENKLIWIHSSGLPVYTNGELVGSRGIAINITKLKETEAQLILAKEEAENANRLKSAFLATMSHELRTPLNAIIGFSQIIDETQSKEDILEMTKIIYNSGTHLLSIIESIFELAMFQSNAARLKHDKFFFSDLIKSLKFFLQSEISKSEKTQISGNFKKPSGSENFVLKTDQTKLIQLLTNLLGNAVKYCNKGEISFEYSIQDRDITFIIKDQGIGIPKEKQAIIFERFRQIDDTSTRRYGGVGLGLAICKEISELLQGELWMESELGVGSTFHFKLKDVLVN